MNAERMILTLVLCCTAAATPTVDEALRAVLAEEQQRVAVIERVTPAVVCVFDSIEQQGAGSGVIIDAAGYGLTNYHVVATMLENNRSGYGGLADGKLYPLRVIGIDPGGDVALFKLEGRERFDAVALGDSDAVRVGQTVIAMGNPFALAEDFKPCVTIGAVSGVHRYQRGEGNALEYADCIQIAASINPGNSGGPLFDLDGDVVGINGRVSLRMEDLAEGRGRVNVGVGYAITANQIRRFLPALYAGESAAHGTLGATVRLIGDKLIVDSIQQGSPAAEAGVKLRDEVLAVEGRETHTPNEFASAVAVLPAGWPARLSLRRDGVLLNIIALLEPMRIADAPAWTVDPRVRKAAVLRMIEGYAESRDDDFISKRRWTIRMETAGGTARDAVVSPDWLTGASDSLGPAGDGLSQEEKAILSEWRQAAALSWNAKIVARLDEWRFVRAEPFAQGVAAVYGGPTIGGGAAQWTFAQRRPELTLVTLVGKDGETAVMWKPPPWGGAAKEEAWTRLTAGDPSPTHVVTITWTLLETPTTSPAEAANP